MGASLEDLRLWLRRYKRIHITRRTILYRLRCWQEASADHMQTKLKTKGPSR